MTTKSSLCIQLYGELPDKEGEFGSCDGFQQHCIQTETVASWLEPNIILAKLRFDITFSRQRGNLPIAICRLCARKVEAGTANASEARFSYCTMGQVRRAE